MWLYDYIVYIGIVLYTFVVPTTTNVTQHVGSSTRWGVQLGLGRFDEAERNCREALRLEPESREAVMTPGGFGARSARSLSGQKMDKNATLSIYDIYDRSGDMFRELKKHYSLFVPKRLI